MSDTFTFEALRVTNLSRCNQHWHPVDEWKPWDWTNAMNGEVGEVCAEILALTTALAMSAGASANLTKKMARVWPSNMFMLQNNNKPEDQRIEDLEVRIMRELGDVVCYSDLLASRMQRRLQDGVREAFNGKSILIGSTARL